MKSASIATKSSSNNSKTKKSTKDREKRKSQSDKQEQHNTEKGSPTKDSTRKYSGIGPDSVVIYSEQSSFEHLSEDVCYGFAEDLSYKLRFVIHDALIRARLSGRNYITSSDVDATFENLNIDKVFGAPAAPNWISLGEQNLSYLDDAIVNLIEVAEEDSSYIQPGDVCVKKKWYPEIKDVSKSLRNYFETICNAIVSQDVDLRQTALNDVEHNNLIGPIVEWFYNFCYFLLSKDITYDCLTLSALDLIKALEDSSIAPLIVSEKQLKLVVRLILQRLLRTQTTPEVMKPMCYTLALLSKRLSIQELVLMKIKQKLPEIKQNFALQIVSIMNALGIQTVIEIFVPNVDYFLRKIEQNFDVEYTNALLNTYNIICACEPDIPEVHSIYYETFGDGIVPVWKSYCEPELKQEKPESNWLNVKKSLVKSRKQVKYENKHSKKYSLMEAFPDNQFEKIKLKTNLTLVENTSFPQQKHVVIGKYTLLIPVLKNVNKKKNRFKNCIDHTLKCYNL